MKTALAQLDKRFAELRGLANMQRPARGWIRAIREALGMTTTQFALRLGVTQPRVIELEKAEASGNINVRSLERAAEALGCRLVYVLMPLKPLTETISQRAEQLADSQVAAIEQSMALEAQDVVDKQQRKEARRRQIEALLRRPARLWDE